MRFSPVAAPLTFAVAATALLAGCGGGGQATSSAPTGAMPPANIPFSEKALPDTTQLTVGVKLEGLKAKTNKKYGKILGYFLGTTSTKAQVVTLSPNTDVVFTNVDSISHTASFLGDATKKSAPWPSTFTGSASASAAGTAIGTTSWSTGILSGGKSSAVYSSGAPGFYMIGCAFHYVSSGMRTVVIVK